MVGATACLCFGGVGGMAAKKPEESAAAREAFSAYVSLGPSRSLRALASIMVEQNQYKTEMIAFNSLARWSTQHNWQERIKAAATERSEAMLREAADLDADTFLKTSRRLNAQVEQAVEPRDVVTIRESVRKPVPRGGASVSVNVSVEVRQLAEQLAKSLGVSADELIQEAEEIASGAWGES